MGKLSPTVTCFCKDKVLLEQPHPFVYVLSKVVFMLLSQN